MSIDMIILPRTSDIGGLEVRRALPFRDRRMVGPFIFWDQMGPGEMLAGQGLDVRPHPHIGLSTVTYLFDGSIDHKDSLGCSQRIRPGDINLMNAGRGIVHSERSGPDVRARPSRIYGIQSWVAQPKVHEEDSPSFTHTGAEALPVFADAGASGRVILGSHEGLRSPVETQWDTLYLDLALEPGTRFRVPAAEERALYVLSGTIVIAGAEYEPMRMLILHPGDEAVVEAKTAVRMMVLGGAAMDGPRFIYWNFVSSSQDRIEQAKTDWKARQFPTVPGDEVEFVPLPE